MFQEFPKWIPVDGSEDGKVVFSPEEEDQYKPQEKAKRKPRVKNDDSITDY